MANHKTSMQVGDRVGMLVIKGVRRVVSPCGTSQMMWLVECDCGATRDMRTNHIRRHRDSVPVSCGCEGRRARKRNAAKARSFIAGARDPTPLEIAERCLDVHNDAGREVPWQLLENLKRLRGV